MRVELAAMMVTGDADWLRQVFAGLFENAAKYAGRGASVAVGGRAEDGMAVVELADTGPGLPPERLEAVFDRFSRGDGAGARLRGRACAGALGGRGSRRQPDGRDPGGRRPAAGGATAAGGDGDAMARILIVEDDPDIASLLCRGLGAAGYAADRAETVEAAVDRVEQGGVDAAIIDMMLGADSGAELLAELRRRGHRMPAIMLSALSRVEDRAEGLDAGAQDYIVKPFQLERADRPARGAAPPRRAAPRAAAARRAHLRSGRAGG